MQLLYTYGVAGGAVQNVDSIQGRIGGKCCVFKIHHDVSMSPHVEGHYEVIDKRKNRK